MRQFFVLGAADPEMQAIERLLTEAGVAFGYAMSGGRRVHPGNAYAATYVMPTCSARPGLPCNVEQPHCMACGCTELFHRADRGEIACCACGCIDIYLASIVVVVECAVDGVTPDVVCDHHRPGDPGYGRQPADYLIASSIGQVVALLAAEPVVPPPDILLIAAADHCLAAAYQGKCPGVDPDALMAWRAASRAAFQHRQVADVLADVEAARQALRAAHEMEGFVDPECQDCYGRGFIDDPHGDYSASGQPSVCACMCGEFIADMRGCHVPELPEASARDGVCFVADGLADRDGRVKVVCQSGSPAQIRAFMHVWAPAHGLTDVYGDPARGFAGGYVP